MSALINIAVFAVLVPASAAAAEEQLPWVVHMGQGDGAAARADWAEAKIEYERAATAPVLCLQLNAAMMRLVRIYSRDHSVPQAVNEWTKRLAAVETGSDRRAALMPLGMTALLANERGDYRKAIAALERFRALQAELKVPADAHAAALLAFLLLADGETGSASALFRMALLPDAEGRKAIETYPDPFDELMEDAVSTWRAWLTGRNYAGGRWEVVPLKDVERRFARLARRAVTTLAAPHPNVATILDAHATVLRKLGRREEAAKQARRASDIWDALAIRRPQ